MHGNLFYGCGTALVTPFKGNRVDFDALEGLIDWQLDCGADAIVVLGTTGFAAPEQYGMGQSDNRSDIYSLGVLMNVMLTGQHPSRQIAPGRFGRIIRKCTMTNPAGRYQTVLDLMEVL